MEHREHKNIQQYINKLIDLIHGFYTDEHFTESGTTYKFIDGKSRERIKFIIESAYYNPEGLGLTDQEELFEMMEHDQAQYIKETLQIDSMINDNRGFYVFITNFNKKVAQIYEQKKRKDIIYPIQQALTKGLQSIEDISYLLKDKHIHIKNTTHTEQGRICLVQTKEQEYVFVNIDKKDITYNAGETKEKRYKFDQTKIFIFGKYLDITQAIHKQLELKTLTDPNTTIQSFLISFIETYSNDPEPFKEKLQTIEKLEDQTIGEVSENIQTTSNLLTTLVVWLGIQPKEYNIFVDHENKKLQHIGKFRSYSTAKKLENGYRGKEAIHMTVNDGEKAIVISSDNYDIFDINP